MKDAQGKDALHVVARRAVPGGTPRRAWPLKGGVSADVTALEIMTADGETVRLVLRRHGEIDRDSNPHVARDEFRVLEIARAHGLAVPRPVLLDESGELLATPFLVIEYVDGEPDLAPADLDVWLDQAVDHLTRIHAVPASAGLAFLPGQRVAPDDGSGEPDRAMGEDAIRAALAAARPPTGTARSSLLHGDYWPGNLLWRGGELVGVIDWEDARTGDPLADVANARLEILWAFGAEAMAGFTERYRALAPAGLDRAGLPAWDLLAALRPCGKLAGWGLDAETERMMRERHAWFVGRAIDRLGTG